jgi:hypothetical protein
MFPESCRINRFITRRPAISLPAVYLGDAAFEDVYRISPHRSAFFTSAHQLPPPDRGQAPARASPSPANGGRFRLGLELEWDSGGELRPDGSVCVGRSAIARQAGAHAPRSRQSAIVLHLHRGRLPRCHPHPFCSGSAMGRTPRHGAPEARPCGLRLCPQRHGFYLAHAHQS